ncbi:hypothetical protein [Gayadomonas joobiniege]|uniref:hypothetical protein n=1 Tax=Gayadomonas joobiniege TaxID=1234606 RepID=UPI000369AF25|nr:hypothetical protein [Gayadomonas joobiniege]
MKPMGFKFKSMTLALVSTQLFVQANLNAAEPIKISVNANMKHIVGGVAELDRSKFITLHSFIGDTNWGNSDAKKGLSKEDAALRDQFLNQYDVYLGRDNGAFPWHLARLKKSAKNGEISVSHVEKFGQQDKQNYAQFYQADPTAVSALEKRTVNMMRGGQPVMYPHLEYQFPCTVKKCSQYNTWIKGFDELAKFYADNLTFSYGQGGTTGEPKPAYIEVMNEPILFAAKHRATAQSISELHVKVAREIKKSHPEIKVGGYTAAWPGIEERDFATFDERWKVFIDTAGKDMDFYSIHIYDSYRGNKEAYRAGANAEAILDMLDQYSLIATGERKPWVISEYGYFTPNPIERAEIKEVGYSRKLDWLNIRSFSSMMMGFLERPDQIAVSMPFHINKALWYNSQNGGVDANGKRYSTRLFVMEEELSGKKYVKEKADSKWVFSDILKWYQLWSDVKGTRVDSFANQIDMQVDAYVDGNKLYLIANNMELSEQGLALDVQGLFNNQLIQVSSKHLYWHPQQQRAVLENERLATSAKVFPIAAEATRIFTFEFANEIKIDQHLNEHKYYASDENSFRQPIKADTPIEFEVNQVNKGKQGEAILRLGLGRKHHLSLTPQVTFNGVELDVPSDVRGHYENKARKDFFGILEIPVPFSAIKKDNRIEVVFADSGGTATTAVLQVFNMSKAIKRPQ